MFYSTWFFRPLGTDKDVKEIFDKIFCADQYTKAIKKMEDAKKNLVGVWYSILTETVQVHVYHICLQSSIVIFDSSFQDSKSKDLDAKVKIQSRIKDEKRRVRKG